MYGSTDNIEENHKYEARVILQAGQPETKIQKNDQAHHIKLSFFEGLEKYNIL